MSQTISYSIGKNYWSKESISVDEFSIQIGSLQMLLNSSFKINMGDKIVLLGKNGCGKTTFFKSLNLIKESFDSSVKKSYISLFEVSQELEENDRTILDLVLSSHLERGKIYERIYVLENKEMTDEELEEYLTLQDKLTEEKAEEDPSRAKKILYGLGFENFDVKFSTLSGGWKARVALAQGLFMEPDILLLDEPTNHLDLVAVLWLTQFCQNWKKTLIVISHNISFITDISTTIWHIQNKKLFTYNCEYQKFLLQHKQNIEKEIKQYELLQKELDALKKKGTIESKKTAESLLKKRTLEGICRPEKPYEPKFLFSEKHYKSNNPLVKITNATIGYNKISPILDSVTFSLYNKSRVALVGKNGAGKSTLVKFIRGLIEPFNGFIEYKRNVIIEEFDQNFYHSLPTDKTPLEFLETCGKKELIRKVLGSSGLPGEAHSRKIGTLSGGQKARVYIASICLKEPDVLLLDEPTNHLDIETIYGLHSALLEYDGAVLLVSHDIHFLHSVATEVWQIADSHLTQRSIGTEGLNEYVEEIVGEFED